MTNYQEKAREIVPTIYTSVMMGKSMGAEKLVVSALAQAEKKGMEKAVEIAHSFRKGNLKVMELKSLLEAEPTARVKILPDGTIKDYDPAIAIAEAIRQAAQEEVK